MSSMTRNNHSLFYKASGESLFGNITLPAAEMAKLIAARDKIRARIRQDLPFLLQKETGDSTLKVRPTFFPQGSVANKTLNGPYRPPEQKADLDDGVYLPLSFAKDYGPPSLVSTVYTQALEQIISTVAREEGWEVDTSNPNCTRVILTEPGKIASKHIDISAYCMPDEEFAALVAKQLALNKSLGKHAYADSAEPRTADDWAYYPEHVYHAHKTKGWEHSDPRPLIKWVEMKVAEKTEQYRRLARYLKAWRDAQRWSKSDPKSILLLMAIDMVFTKPMRERDDLALTDVVHALPTVIGARIYNQAEPQRKEDLTERLDRDGIRGELILNLHRLAGVLDQIQDESLSNQQVNTMLCAEWGNRFAPPAPEAAKRPAEVVRQAPAVVIASKPTVGPRYSG